MKKTWFWESFKISQSNKENRTNLIFGLLVPQTDVSTKNSTCSLSNFIECYYEDEKYSIFYFKLVEQNVNNVTD